MDPSIPASISTTEVRPYIERHIALFSTLQQLSPRYFNQSTNFTVPETILTAPAHFVAEDANDIFGIMVAARFSQPPSDFDDELEYVYKITSSKPIHNDEIARLLGYNLDSTGNKSESQTLDDLGVTWLHRQAWPHAYPQYNPEEPVRDSIEIAPDLFYTAAAEQTPSTMEMSCRMGKNVAERLCDSKWLGELIP
ncbi:hypothetical protein N7G274_003535 [Stereocaulon virgatum]|uniref:Prenylcysteine lyase domain-containing protein n=1 Tax=Stereocaulon virgatum TaxID=373712 RepID=A0ABR4AH20_9LECA